MYVLVTVVALVLFAIFIRMLCKIEIASIDATQRRSSEQVRELGFMIYGAYPEDLPKRQPSEVACVRDCEPRRQVI